MKEKLLTIFFAAVNFSGIVAQNTWTQKANFGGTGRYFATGFSIGNKGYIGTGFDGIQKQDFWEWDKATNFWTQKANFPGIARDNAAGFSIGTKGYIGIGGIYPGTTSYQDFWEWDQATNTWTQKANFAGTAKEGVACFSIGTNGYIGTGGAEGGPYYNDFWEWNQGTNAWTQKANFAGTARYGARGFSIGTKGYIGTGKDGSWTNDFWEWDQATNTWTQKANFGGVARYCSSSFAIGTKGYIGTGYNGIYQQDVWEWDQSTNVWTQIANYGGGLISSAIGFSIGNCGYIGTGGSSAVNFGSGFWEYCPSAVATPTISSSGSTTICVGQNTTLTVFGAVNYSWNTGATTSSISVSPSITTGYSVITTNGCSCSGINNITITVIPCIIPISSFSAASNAICAGNCVQFNDQSNGSPSTWQWEFSGGNPSSSNLQNPLVCYDSSGTYYVSLTVANFNGSDSSSQSNYMIVTDCYCTDIYIPNAFSPNGDGENDFLKIYYGNLACIKTLQLSIYDRWGENVFKTTVTNFQWDGKYMGKMLNTQVLTYYLQIEFSDQTVLKKKGNISLVR